MTRGSLDNNYCGVNNYANTNVRRHFFMTASRAPLTLSRTGTLARGESHTLRSPHLAWMRDGLGRDNWAKTVSPNKNVKVYIGAPASSTAAGSGYVSASTLATIISQTKSAYSSFGGVMLWDASQAYGTSSAILSPL